MPPNSRQLSDHSERGALQAAHEALADYPAVVAMHEEQTERAEAEVARLRAALEKLTGAVEETSARTYRESWGSPAELTHIDPDEWREIAAAAVVAREALNGGTDA